MTENKYFYTFDVITAASSDALNTALRASKEAHMQEWAIVGFHWDGTNYHVLVQYRS